MLRNRASLAAPAGASNNTEPAALKLDTSLEPRSLETAPFINESECLRWVPVSRRTWFDWREKKKLPFIRVGKKRIIYNWNSVREWLLRQERGGQQ